MSYFEIKTEIAIGLLLLVLYITYYLMVEVKVPVVACGSSSLRTLVEGLPLVSAPYWPPAWCLQAHAHTVLASLLRSRWLAGPPRGWRRQAVPLADGGEGSLWWARHEADRPAARGAMLLIPGLCGDHRADYVRVLLPAAAELGVRLVVYTHRGLAGQPLKSARLYSAVSEEDVTAALALLADTLAAGRGSGDGCRGAGDGCQGTGDGCQGTGDGCGDGAAPLLLGVGVSLGGVLLARHLAAAGTRSPLTAAMLISAPLDVEKGAAGVERGVLNRLLSWHMARSLSRTLSAHNSLTPLGAAHEARSLRQFDAAFTAPHFGFPSPEQYYAAASLRPLLASITVPTLALNAADDPYQTEEALPWAEVRSCRRVALVVPARGGHIGFLSACRPLSYHPLAALAEQYFRAVLRHPGLCANRPRPTSAH